MGRTCGCVGSFTHTIVRALLLPSPYAVTSPALASFVEHGRGLAAWLLTALLLCFVALYAKTRLTP
jgi:hypothetical protein